MSTSVSSTAQRKLTHRTAGLCRWYNGSRCGGIAAARLALSGRPALCSVCQSEGGLAQCCAIAAVLLARRGVSHAAGALYRGGRPVRCERMRGSNIRALLKGEMLTRNAQGEPSWEFDSWLPSRMDCAGK